MRDMVRSGNTLPERDVTDMFDAIAPVYDRLNTVMTLGVDARWRRRAAGAAELTAGDSVIDVACGTGKLAAELARIVGPFGRVEAVDLSNTMVARGAAQHRALVQVRFRVANALDLPFADGSFDAATIAFGLRNLSDFEAGFREMSRVVRPGGRVVCLELSLPPARLLARAFQGTFRRVAPAAARLIGGRTSAYQYLPASLDGFPSADDLVATMRSAGLMDIRLWRLSAGVVALHRGVVPG